MVFIFGGAYQGKLDYAKNNYSLETVFDCRAGAPTPEMYADIICGLEAFVKDCSGRGIEAADWFRERKEEWRDKVLIMQDMSQGIVPMDKEERSAREMNGRLMIYLAGEADEGVRVFCGIGERIK